MYRLLHLYFAFAVLYGSVLPLNFRLLSFEQFRQEVVANSVLRFDTGSLEEMCANFLLYVPLGALTFLVWAARRSTGVAYGVALAIALSTSIVAEVFQGFLPGRYSSLLDVLLNASGALLGACSAELLLQCMRRFHLQTVPGAGYFSYALSCVRSRGGLWCCGVVTLVYGGMLLRTFAVLPDSTTLVIHRIPELLHMPFVDFQKANYLTVFTNGLVKVLLFFPLGILLSALLFGLGRNKVHHTALWCTAVPLLVLFCLLIECLQLGSVEKTASLSDVAIYLVGALSGSLLSSFMRHQALQWRKQVQRDYLPRVSVVAGHSFQ